MERPKKVVRENYDYRQCAKFIGEKLGYSIDDTLNSFESGYEFRSYWHFILDHNQIHIGCFFYLPPVDAGTPWQQEITKAFNEEFGEDEEYWIG